MKILWCVTGAGQFLSESLEAVNKSAQAGQVTLVFSRAGYEVCRMYGLLSEIETKFQDLVTVYNKLIIYIIHVTYKFSIYFRQITTVEEIAIFFNRNFPFNCMHTNNNEKRISLTL